MSIVIIGIVGITSVLLAVQLKGTKSEYGIYLVMAAGCFMFFYGAARLEDVYKRQDFMYKQNAAAAKGGEETTAQGLKKPDRAVRLYRG